MRKEEICDHLMRLAFCFFYKYSRFEFALKENDYVKAGHNRLAKPDWCKFVDTHCEHIPTSDEAKELMEASPKCQVVAANNSLEWKVVELHRYTSDLGKVVRVVQTVRNNLFHGGKHGVEDWDNPKRTEKLLKLGIAVLDQIAKRTDFHADYTRYY